MKTHQIITQSESEVDLIEFMGGDDRVCTSARVSFGNDERLKDKGASEGLINFLYKNQHMTPFESSVFTFRIRTPIFVAREFFRHRSASYNEWSGRYSEMSSEFFVPDSDRPLVQAGKPGDYYFIAGTEEQYESVLKNTLKAYEVAWEAYQNMLDDGVAKEVARNVLPLGIYTYFYVTMNARNLMHFLNLRDDSHALAEIREVAEGMGKFLEERMPITYEAFKKYGV